MINAFLSFALYFIIHNLSEFSFWFWVYPGYFLYNFTLLSEKKVPNQGIFQGKNVLEMGKKLWETQEKIFFARSCLNPE